MKKTFEKMMSMDEKTWRRHANPWSVWTRVITGIPLLFSAVWTFGSDGVLTGSLYTGGVVFWLWLNPRLFPEPSDTNNWASKVTFGEKIWLHTPKKDIPPHHINWANFLSGLIGVGFILGIYGCYNNLILPALLGGVVCWIGKMWFCDRMVWLYDEISDRSAPQVKH